MQKVTVQKIRILVLLVVGTLVTTSPALAEKPSWAGGDKSKKHEQTQSRKGYKSEQPEQKKSGGDYKDREDEDRHAYFGDQHRNFIQSYYTERYNSGRCPPGLAKKGNGCMPPGQNRKWQIGRPLPKDVIFHNLPSVIAEQLGSPPPKHRFVRVASDILMIAVGTGMVIDAIEDMGRI